MEPPNLIYYVTSVVGLLLLIGLYFFGVWSRTYVVPAHDNLPLSRQLVAAVPVGFITMGLYAKSAFPALELSTLAFDVIVMAGYAIIFGMLSRESLDRLLHSTVPPARPSSTN